ncbi:helix-turn-helix domain-containing protein [Microtetraspora malaysiensis]|uniref:Helix-turn-helix domain-containing protein n=1 Tax=Microtetraspora malaysiensis TaxID=161358 RepID=A0ABW6SNH9_9ACTN
MKAEISEAWVLDAVDAWHDAPRNHHGHVALDELMRFVLGRVAPVIAEQARSQERAAMGAHSSRYSDLADVLAVLPTLLRAERRARSLGMRDVAAQSGVSASTVCRVENGDDCRMGSAGPLLRWLDATTNRHNEE